jgi:hypothetical protein
METQVQTVKQEIQPYSPGHLLEMAIDKNLDIDKLERLLEMKERWDKEQARKAFFEALAAFQEECPDLRKTKPVSYKEGDKPAYYYAPLSDIDRQIKGLLKKHGLTKRFEIVQDASKITGVTCIITHTLGHSEATTVPIIADTSGGKNAIQAIGSGVQYGQRYSLIAALGITTADQDIDGRLPELDVDKLHKQYMELYQKICEKDPSFRSAGDPDNWKGERTPALYVKAIGRARQFLAQLTK